MSERKVTVVVVGCGDRANVYLKAGVKEMDRLQIVAAVDPNPERLRYMREEYGITEAQCYTDMKDVLSQGRIADCVINGTMDQLHVETSIPFLEQGYHMLLEKPIVNNREELLKIRDTANKNNCKLMICHVLRYAPFYTKMKELILSGELGEIMNIQSSERVGAYHSSVSYVRGKWGDCGSSLLLAKCCHDMDLLCWLNNTTIPEVVYSHGGRDFFLEEKAPKGAGTRCMVDCPDEVRKKCVYDAENMYLENDLLPWYPWQCTGKNYQDVTFEEKKESLETYNPHGACAYRCKGTIVDHQNVTVTFANGSTAVHTVTLGAMHPGRRMWIQGTLGEVEGWSEDGILRLYKYNKEDAMFKETVFNFNDTKGETGGHYGGDRRLVNDFCSLMEGEEPSVSCTSIDDSIWGHLACYAADESLEKGEIVKL